MAAKLSLFWEVAIRGFRRYSTYRAATVAGVFTNTVFAFIQVYVLLAIAHQRGTIRGFNGEDLVTFSFVREGLTVALGAFGSLELGDRIRTGDVVSDLYRPIDLWLWWMAQDAGRMAFQLLTRAAPVFVVGAAVFRLELPRPEIWLAFAVTLVPAFLISFAFRFLLSLSGFWLLDARGANQLGFLVFGFFSGFLLPLALFPSFLRGIANLLPFEWAVERPIEVFLGKRTGLGALSSVVGHQLVWFAVLLLLGRILLRAAWHKVVVQGG